MQRSCAKCLFHTKIKRTSKLFRMSLIWNLFKNAIKDDIKNPEFVDKFNMSYSTTTSLISTVSNITLMNTMKEYFLYGMQLSCGIPMVILEGTQEDWNSLKTFYEYFKNMLKNTELKTWFSHFDVIFDMFIEMRNLKCDGII